MTLPVALDTNLLARLLTISIAPSRPRPVSLRSPRR